MQSEEHTNRAMMQFPTIASIAAQSNSYTDFAYKVRSLNSSGTVNYTDEWNNWYNQYGKQWNRLGCIRENKIGGRAATQFLNMNYNMSGTSSTAADITTLNSTDTPTPNDYFKIQDAGWTACSPEQEPPGAKFVSGPSAYPLDPDWQYKTYADPYDSSLRYLKMYYPKTGKGFWWYPPGVSCGTNTSSSVRYDKAMIKEIQSALNKNYLEGSDIPVLKVDGIWGPKTCGAAYAFKQDILNDYGVTLNASFFRALDLPENYEEYFDVACTSYYTKDGVPLEEPKPVTGTKPSTPTPATTEPSVEAQKAGFPLWLALILGGSAVGMLIFKRGKKSKR